MPPLDKNDFRLFFICTIIIAASTFVTLLGSIFVIFLPLILFYHHISTGFLKACCVFLVSLIIFFPLGIFFQLTIPYPEILTLGLSGTVMAAIVRKGGSFQKTVSLTSFIVLSLVGAFLLYSAHAQNTTIAQIIKSYVAEAIQYNLEMYSRLPLGRENINLVLENSQNIIDILVRIFPSLIVVLCVFTVWFNLLLGRNLLRQKGILLSRLNYLSNWSAPEFVIWIFIASGALIFWGNYQLSSLGMNLMIIVCFVYLLQGLAIISFIFQNKNAPLLFRYLIYFFIAVQQFFMLAVVAVGLLDIWVDFRKFFQNKNIVA